MKISNYMRVLLLKFFLGGIIAQTSYCQIAGPQSGPMVVNEGNKYYLIKASNGRPASISYVGGDILLPYTSAENFNNGFSIVGIHGKSGLMDTSGYLVIDTIYSAFKFNRISAQYIVITRNNKYGVVLADNHILIDTVYQKIESGFYFYSLQKDGKCGLANKAGKVIIPILYDQVNPYFDEGLASFKLQNKYGFIDSTGKIKIQPAYEEVESFYQGLTVVTIAGKNFLINKAGKQLNKKPFDGIGQHSKKLIPVMKNEKWGFIDQKMNLIIPYQYETADAFRDEYTAQKEDTLYYFNEKGEIIKSQKVEPLRTIQTENKVYIRQ